MYFSEEKNPSCPRKDLFLAIPSAVKDLSLQVKAREGLGRSQGMRRLWRHGPGELSAWGLGARTPQHVDTGFGPSRKDRKERRQQGCSWAHVPLRMWSPGCGVGEARRNDISEFLRLLRQRLHDAGWFVRVGPQGARGGLNQCPAKLIKKHN